MPTKHEIELAVDFRWRAKELLRLASIAQVQVVSDELRVIAARYVASADRIEQRLTVAFTASAGVSDPASSSGLASHSRRSH